MEKFVVKTMRRKTTVTRAAVRAAILAVMKEDEQAEKAMKQTKKSIIKKSKTDSK